MSKAIHQYILSKISERENENNFRTLKPPTYLIDFCSNDYLGFSRSEVLYRNVEEEVRRQKHIQIGSTGSRLLSGNSEYAEALERKIADFHGAESAIIFNSGFDANYGLLSTLPYRGDTIIFDELVHASLHDGLRNSKAKSVTFLHNDTSSLEEALKQAKGLKFVVIESVYSMNGDFAHLQEIAELCKKYEAGLIVDEAHATGVFGEHGEGLVNNSVETVARIHTYGKAMGTHGAAIVCSNALKTFLVNYCRPFIFSTALPFHCLASISCAYDYLHKANEQRNNLHQLILLFKDCMSKEKNIHLLPSDAPIQSVIFEGNNSVKAMAANIQAAGFDVRPILYPTVPKGQERIRICLHSFNTEAEVVKLAETICSL